MPGAEAARVHRYRNSRPWSVGALAAMAAAGAMLVTGTVSTAFDGEGWLGPQIRGAGRAAASGFTAKAAPRPAQAGRSARPGA